MPQTDNHPFTWGKILHSWKQRGRALMFRPKPAVLWAENRPSRRFDPERPQSDPAGNRWGQNPWLCHEDAFRYIFSSPSLLQKKHITLFSIQGKTFFFLFWKVKSKKFNLTEQTKLIWDEIYSLREFHNFIIIRPNPKCVRPEQTSTERTPTLTVAQNSGESGVFTSKSQQLSN